MGPGSRGCGATLLCARRRVKPKRGKVAKSALVVFSALGTAPLREPSGRSRVNFYRGGRPAAPVVAACGPACGAALSCWRVRVKVKRLGWGWLRVVLHLSLSGVTFGAGLGRAATCAAGAGWGRPWCRCVAPVWGTTGRGAGGRARRGGASGGPWTAPAAVAG